MNNPTSPCAYTRELAAALRPKYGRFAAALAEAFVDLTNDRPRAGMHHDERIAFIADARARFNRRAGRIKTAWAKDNAQGRV